MTELKKGTRVTGDARKLLRENLVKGYASGQSVRGLAKEHGRSYGNIHRLLSEAGVTFRNRGGARHRPPTTDLGTVGVS